MSDFMGFEISATGLTAQRLRMDVISNNIANVNTTRTPNGGPYRRQQVVFESRLRQALAASASSSDASASGGGVRVTGIIEDQSEPLMVYDPQHPDANKAGFVAMPNINIVNEMVDLIAATRAYEANLSALNSAKTMATKALDIARF